MDAPEPEVIGEGTNDDDDESLDAARSPSGRFAAADGDLEGV